MAGAGADGDVDRAKCQVPSCGKEDCLEWGIWTEAAEAAKLTRTKWRDIQDDLPHLSMEIVSHTEIWLVHARRPKRPWRLHFPFGVLRCNSCKTNAKGRCCLHMNQVFVLLGLLRPKLEAPPVTVGKKSRNQAAVRRARRDEERELPKLIMELTRILPRSLCEQTIGRPRHDVRDVCAAYLLTIHRKQGMRYGSGASQQLVELGASVAPSEATICRFGRQEEHHYWLRYLQMASCLPARELISSGAMDGTGLEDRMGGTYQEKTMAYHHGKDGADEEARAKGGRFPVDRNYVMDATWQDYQFNLKPVTFPYRHEAYDMQGRRKVKVENDPHRPRGESSYFPTVHLAIGRYFPNVLITRGDKAYAGRANHHIAKELGMRPVIDLPEKSGTAEMRGRKNANLHRALVESRIERDADPQAWANEYHRRSHKEGCHYGEKVVNGPGLRSRTWISQDSELYARKILDNLRVMLYLRYIGHHVDFRVSKAILDAEPLPDLEDLAKQYYSLSTAKKLSQIEDLTHREVAKVKQARERLKGLVSAA